MTEFERDYDSRFLKAARIKEVSEIESPKDYYCAEYYDRHNNSGTDLAAVAGAIVCLVSGCVVAYAFWAWILGVK